MFTYTKTEDFVLKLLLSLGIKNPQELTIENVAKLLKIKVKYWEFGSETSFYRGKTVIYLQHKETDQAQWQEFCHELCHAFWHAGRQEFLPYLFVQLQEYQANLFAYHFTVPTFMLERVSDLSVRKIMNLFNVEYEFAERRLEMYKNKLLTMR